MKNLYIIGAGDFGREVESWFDLYSSDKINYQIAGYLDDNLSSLDQFPSDYTIKGRINDFEFCENDQVILAISNPSIKENIYRRLLSKVIFYTFIPVNAIVAKYSEIGEGSIIAPNAIISTNVKLGKCVIVNIGTQIGHDAVIKDFCSLMANVDIGGNVQIGRKVFIGSNATIIPEISVVDDAVIGAGSIVINKIVKPHTVFGNPAKKI